MCPIYYEDHPYKIIDKSPNGKNLLSKFYGKFQFNYLFENSLLKHENNTTLHENQSAISSFIMLMGWRLPEEEIDAETWAFNNR